MNLIVTTPADLAKIVSDAVAAAIRNHAPAVEHDRWMTAEEAAEFLRVNRSTVYELTRAGKLPHRKIGKVVRYVRRELDDYLESSGQG